MRSLFIKIFLWFWLTNILVIAAVALATSWMPSAPRREQFRAMIDETVAMYGQKGIARYESQGPAALARYLRETEARTGLHLLLFDDQGRELLHQATPDNTREIAQKALQSGKAEMHPSFDRGPLIAQRVHGADGQTYVVAEQSSRGGPMADLLRKPQAIIARLLAVVSVAGLLCYGLAHYLTAPLRRLRASARRLAEGDLTVRVGKSVGNRHDEMGDLGRDFDFMAERVESLVLKERQLLRDMSHELRSPLARLNLALGLAVQRAGPQAQTALARIEREATRLNDLIGKLLTVARLESSDVAGTKNPVDMAQMVREIVADADFEARNNYREVSLLRCDACRVLGISDMLRSAIENVVRNAIRYTAGNTQVLVSLYLQQDYGSARAIVHVRDHGPGVPEEMVEDIFRPFCRVSEDRDRQTGGVGLGLAIARQAVRLHGGTIYAANVPHGGLAVEISLPALAEANTAARASSPCQGESDSARETHI